jgi:hypothetical protein
VYGAGEDDMSKNFDAITHQCWQMAQRVGTQIAELPMNARDGALAGTESCLRAAGGERGVEGQQLDSIVEIQMTAIRQAITDIDAKENRRVGKP